MNRRKHYMNRRIRLVTPPPKLVVEIRKIVESYIKHGMEERKVRDKLTKLNEGESYE